LPLERPKAENVSASGASVYHLTSGPIAAWTQLAVGSDSIRALRSPCCCLHTFIAVSLSTVYAELAGSQPTMVRDTLSKIEPNMTAQKLLQYQLEECPISSQIWQQTRFVANQWLVGRVCRRPIIDQSQQASSDMSAAELAGDRARAADNDVSAKVRKKFLKIPFLNSKTTLYFKFYKGARPAI